MIIFLVCVRFVKWYCTGGTLIYYYDEKYNGMCDFINLKTVWVEQKVQTFLQF